MPRTLPMNILIADDDAIFREGLKAFLMRHFQDISFGEAGTPQAVLEQIWKLPWNIMLLAMTWPGCSDMAILKYIKTAKPNLPVLMLSMHPEQIYGVRALQAGAAGYVTKREAPHELVRAIESVLAGGDYAKHSTVERLVQHLPLGPGSSPHQKLSYRQFEIMRLLASGKSTKEIAGGLCISPKTVSTHRRRILQKLTLRTTAELIRYAFQHSLIE